MIKTSLLGKIAKALLCISLGASIALGISGCGGNKPKSPQQIANETGKPVTVHSHFSPSKTYYPPGYLEKKEKEFNEKWEATHPISAELADKSYLKTYNQQSQYYNSQYYGGSGREKNEEVYVNGYFRSDGTYVSGHYRTTRDNYKSNNYSYIGNVNPHTGKKGYNY